MQLTHDTYRSNSHNFRNARHDGSYVGAIADFAGARRGNAQENAKKTCSVTLHGAATVLNRARFGRRRWQKRGKDCVLLVDDFEY